MLKQLARDERGSVALIFAMCSLMLLGMISLAIDYGRALTSQVRLQQALDGALLAAASDTSNTSRTTVAQNYLNAAYFDKSSSITSSNFTYNTTTQTISGTVVASMSTAMSGWWKGSFDVKATSTVGIGQTKVRALDIVMCIDSTGSMGNTLAAVQTNALNFKNNLDTALQAQGLPSFDQYRVRVVYYKDYGGMGFFNLWYPGWFTGALLGDSVPLQASSFFNLPTDTTSFTNFVTGVYANGGGDLPESGLECLNEAMDSSWTSVGTVLSNGKSITDVYPVIAIFTDAGAHPPNFTYSVQNPNYPSTSKMPRDYAGLLSKWNSSSEIDQTHKMILFYGDPTIEDDYYFYNTSGWETIKTWPGFSNPGSLTSANTSFITSLATGISSMYAGSRLLN